MNLFNFTTTHHQFVRFIVVGFMNTLLDMGVYLLLTRGSEWWLTHYLWANVIAFLISNSHSFLWNRNWTFCGKGKIWIEYNRFLTASLSYLVFLHGLFWLLTVYANWYDVIAKLVVVIIGSVIYFIILKQWTFRFLPNKV